MGQRSSAACRQVSTPQIEEQSADILKLDIDCLEEVFDYLPLEDLIAVGETCKRLQAVAGHCYRQHYSNTRVMVTSKGIEVYKNDHDINITHFAPFIHEIKVYSLANLQTILKIHTKLRRLKQIELKRLKLEVPEINCLKEMLSKVECMRAFDCNFYENFDAIIDHCPKLRRLKIIECSMNYRQLIRKYQTLEYLQFIPRRADNVKGISKLLALNTNIRKFATTAKCLWENRNEFTVGIDELAIWFDRDGGRSVKLDPFVPLLNEMYERGVYKRLQLYFWEISNYETIDQLATLNGLVKLYVNDYVNRFAFSKLKNLEEVCLFENYLTIDLESTFDDLIKLRRIHFCVAKSDDVIPFIQRAAALERIKVDCLRHGTHFNQKTNAIDLPTLNRLREKMPHARKIMLYVDEKVYLDTKWALKETDFELIRLKRVESFEWDHDFDFD